MELSEYWWYGESSFEQLRPTFLDDVMRQAVGEEEGEGEIGRRRGLKLKRPRCRVKLRFSNHEPMVTRARQETKKVQSPSTAAAPVSPKQVDVAALQKRGRIVSVRRWQT